MPRLPQPIIVGTAGWSIPKAYGEAFPATGSHMERYAQVLPGVEINSSFYRPHQPKTYARWAQSVPDDFQFAVKVPKTITHERRLRDITEPLDRFLAEAIVLGPKLGPLLVQLPPSLRFDNAVAQDFLRVLRERFDGTVVCEPRHVSWFVPEVEQVLTNYQVARVAADPAVVPEAGGPGGWDGLIYYRLHGSPRIYYSEYSTDYLDALIGKLRIWAERAPAWCVFDNTAGFAATGNALVVWKAMQVNDRINS